MAEPTLNVPPFPTLIWNGYSWSGEVVLGSWAGFLSRLGSYGSASSNGESDGRVRVNVTSEDGRPNPLIPEQVRAFQFLLDHEKVITESVLRAILAEYPRLRKKYRGQVMPAIRRADQLRPMIGPSVVHVLQIASGGVATSDSNSGAHGIVSMVWELWRTETE
jgi:hypothetical protein